MRKKILFLMLTLLTISLTSYAKEPTSFSLNESKQLIIVVSSDWSATQAVLFRYQRKQVTENWQLIGEPIPVVIGKRGMAWGTPFAHDHPFEPVKKEGDDRSPAGFFPIGTAFGFAPTVPNLKLPYLPISPTIVCVDDPQSVYYNQIINSAKVSNTYWHSGEQMAHVPNYLLGAVIDYNRHQVADKGSCIFIHIWTSPTHGTSGCIALSEHFVQEILTWIVPTQHPFIVILPHTTYDQIRALWHLPKLASSTP